MSNELPLPASPAVSVIPVTYADNHIPLNYEQVQLLISGSDLVVQSDDGKRLILPLGAKLASLNNNLYTLSFADGKVINSDDLLQVAKVDFDSPGMNRAGKEVKAKPVAESLPENVVIKEVINQVIIEEDLGGEVDDESEGTSATAVISADNIEPLPKKPLVESLLVKSSSSGTAPETPGPGDYSGASEQPSNPVTPSDSSGNDVTVMPMSLLQTSGIADEARRVWTGGTGNAAAASSSDWGVQYAATNIDLSSQTQGWTVQVNNQQVIPEGYVGRVLRLDSSAGDITVSGLPGGYRLITADSSEGRLYQLQPNEMLLIYPEGHKASFELTFTYTSTGGVRTSESAKFVIVDNPSTNIDNEGRFQLSSEMNEVNVIGGAGDDRIIAGSQRGTYDGGAGHNIVDYSQATRALNVNLSEGASSLQGSDKKLHGLVNIQEVIGSDYDDVLIGDANDNVLRGGAGDDRLSGGGGNNTLDGGSGVNTASYADARGGVSVDLSANAASDNGLGGQDTLLNIQNIIGSAHDDVLIGDGADNHIQGGGGDDVLMGLGGNNVLDGGAGTNTVSYERGANGVRVDFSTGSATNGYGGTDTLINIQQAIGSAFDDEMITGRGSYYLRAGNGNDVLIVNGDTASRAILDGGAGDDLFIAGYGVNKFIGGGGFDTVDYSRALSGIDVNLQTGQVYNNGFGDMDTLEGISAIVGTRFADRFTLGNGDSTINAGDGDDEIIAGSGNHRIDGGSGTNTVDYSQALSAINVDLVSGAVTSNGFGGQDALTNVQRILGSSFDDEIAGGNGDDVIYGNAGNDVIYGSLGSDLLYGGAGNNRLDYSRVSEGVTVDVINGRTTKSNGDTDIFSGFTQFTGTSGNDVFISPKAALTINGGAGMDTVDYSQLSVRITVDLRSGKATKYDASNASFLDQSLISIEKIIFPKGVSGTGSVGYTSTSGSTWFVGGNGNDTFYVMGGSNTITGGGGWDWVSYSSARSGVTVRVDANHNGMATANGYGGQDVLNGIAYLQGSNYDDYLAGNSILNGRNGNDTLEGTGNNAVAYYREVGTGIVADLEAGIVSNDGYGCQDTLINVHHIQGSNSGDIVYGSSKDNQISTFDGNDLIYGSKGNDTINGGDGIDTVDYSLLDAAVNANLSTGAVDKGVNGKDTLSLVENLTGTAFDDVLTGNALDNILTGGGGNDLLIGGAGNDLLIGGNGFVTASYQTSTSGIVANLSTGSVNDGLGGVDTLVQIDKILGSSYSDTFKISSSADLLSYWIDGGAGTDTLKKSGAGQAFDLTGAGVHISNVERFDFADGASDNVHIDLNTLFTGQVGGASMSLHTDASDTVNLSGAGWSMIDSGSDSETWSNGSQTFSHTWA
ncbi:calcium-binding protein [Leminorella grimontii]|uniref:calcium-binding protein n=1 Tax=Leminorella grimontii TaxID=82981 RepID=UPI00207E8CAC|nr:hypothetical protein [Leminorella grimontii]GKX61237.1 hypothetical protein SOASR031_35520 [Leminorella grimontii]